MSLNPIESFQRLSFFFLPDFLVAFGTSEHSLLFKPLLWHHTLVFSYFLGNSFLLSSLLVRLLKLVLFRVCPELSYLFLSALSYNYYIHSHSVNYHLFADDPQINTSSSDIFSDLCIQ